MIPAAQWWSIIESYGLQIWPAQIVMYGVALAIVVGLLLKSGSLFNALTRAYMALAFAWSGILFFLVLAKDITGDTPGHYIFGAAFILVALVFLLDLFRKSMDFKLPAAGWQRILTLILLILVFCYPLVGLTLGRSMGSLIVPGTLPCPTTALGLLLLTMALPRANKLAYILLLAWAIPFPPAIQIPKYGVYEDSIMLAVGIFALILLIMNWRQTGKAT